MLHLHTWKLSLLAMHPVHERVSHLVEIDFDLQPLVTLLRGANGVRGLDEIRSTFGPCLSAWISTERFLPALFTRSLLHIKHISTIQEEKKKQDERGRTERMRTLSLPAHFSHTSTPVSTTAERLELQTLQGYRINSGRGRLWISMCASVGFFVCSRERWATAITAMYIIPSRYEWRESSFLLSAQVCLSGLIHKKFLKKDKKHLFYGCIRNLCSGKWNLQRDPLMKSLFSHGALLEALCHYGHSLWNKRLHFLKCIKCPYLITCVHC